MRLYEYVGPKQIAERAQFVSAGFPILTPGDVQKWVRESAQSLSQGVVTATFVVDANGVLLIADRRSEHVACAGRKPVLSAGEISFAIGSDIEVIGITNQSTGYCPEPESWPAVAQALSRAGLAFPDGFTMACIFRRCVACACVTLVKDGAFFCGMCGATLPSAYNV